MWWVSSLFGFVWLSVFRFMHHSPENREAYVDNQNCSFYKVIKMWNRLHHCVSLIEMVKKTYMEHPIRSPDKGVMPPERCSIAESSDPSRKFWQLSELSGSLKKPARVPEVIPTSGVPTKVRSSDTQKFRRRSELSTDLIKNSVQIWPFGFWSELFQTRGKLRK
jgi:hypothetical protein